MYDRLLTFDRGTQHSLFIFGPRGTGKTSWIRHCLPDELYFDLLDAEIYSDFMASPSRLGQRVPEAYQGWVIIDEIQKVPALLNEVHRLIEHRKLRFILTGSSARSLRRAGVNLLAGRALIYNMHPLTSLELGGDFELQQALRYGLLPAVIGHSEPQRYLSSYVASYLREEVLQEGLVRNIALFTKFLETASFSQGEVLNYSEIAREVASNRHTVANFFEILEDLLIAHRLPVFTKRAKRKMTVQPKFYYFDVGVYRSIRPMGPLDSVDEIEGPALETLFLQQLKALNDYYELGYKIYFWRTQSQVEVDFIVYGNKGLFAFEIKRKSSIGKKDLSGLRLFAKDYPMAKLFLLYGGERSYHDGGIDVLPFQEALTGLLKLLENH